MSQEGIQSQHQPSTENTMPPSQTSARSADYLTDRPDPSPGESSACDSPLQQGSAAQAEGTGQPTAPRAAASDASHSRTGHSAPFTLDPGLADELEGSAPEQEGLSEEQDEEDRPGDVTLPSGDLGLGGESEAGPGAMSDGGGGELDLPEEGWMWSVPQAHEKERTENKKSMPARHCKGVLCTRKQPCCCQAHELLTYALGRISVQGQSEPCMHASKAHTHSCQHPPTSSV